MKISPEKTVKDEHTSDQEEFEEEEEEEEVEEVELKPHRPELDNVISQRIKLLIPPSSGPAHPRTLFFLNDPKLNENEIDRKKLQIVDVTIKDKNYMVLYKSCYKKYPLPLCISGPMKYNGLIRSKLIDNTNIIWKLMKKEVMFTFLNSLNKYQRYSHFPTLWDITRKDNLYINFKKMQKNFPKDYTYMPETYIIPKNLDIFKEKIQNLDLTDKNHLWIVKPPFLSRGRGIKILTDINSIPKKAIISHYVSNPHLINGKKYDLRTYLLITGYCPIKIYLFDNGLVRFCSEKYDLDPKNMNEKFVHLTNYAVNKTNSKFESNEVVEGEIGHKWTIHTLKKYFIRNGLDFQKVWDKIKDVMVKIILSVADSSIKTMKKFNLSSNNIFELHGVDILLDENLNPWLMEVNLNPSLDCDSNLDLVVKSKLLTDIYNIIGIIPFSHDGKFTPLDKPNYYKDSVEEAVIESLCEFERPSGGFERIFPLKDNYEYYKKFIKSPGLENTSLWEKLKKLK